MDHSKCSHEKTKAARAKCRRQQATGKPRPKGSRKVRSVKDRKGVRYLPEEIVAQEHSNGEVKIQSAQYVWEHREEFSADEVRAARQYLFGS